jgi:hypothetical protein
MLRQHRDRISKQINIRRDELEMKGRKAYMEKFGAMAGMMAGGGTALKEDFLFVRKEKAKSMSKIFGGGQWKKRYVTLQDGKLVQRYDATHKMDLVTIDMDSAKVKILEDHELPSQYRGKGNGGFSITAKSWKKKSNTNTSTRVFEFVATSPSVADTWIYFLKYATEHLAEESKKGSGGPPGRGGYPAPLHPVSRSAGELPAMQKSTSVGDGMRQISAPSTEMEHPHGMHRSHTAMGLAGHGKGTKSGNRDGWSENPLEQVPMSGGMGGGGAPTGWSENPLAKHPRKNTLNTSRNPSQDASSASSRLGISDGLGGEMRGLDAFKGSNGGKGILNAGRRHTNHVPGSGGRADRRLEIATAQRPKSQSERVGQADREALAKEWEAHSRDTEGDDARRPPSRDLPLPPDPPNSNSDSRDAGLSTVQESSRDSVVGMGSMSGRKSRARTGDGSRTKSTEMPRPPSYRPQVLTTRSSSPMAASAYETPEMAAAEGDFGGTGSDEVVAAAAAEGMMAGMVAAGGGSAGGWRGVARRVGRVSMVTRAMSDTHGNSAEEEAEKEEREAEQQRANEDYTRWAMARAEAPMRSGRDRRRTRDGVSVGSPTGGGGGGGARGGSPSSPRRAGSVSRRAPRHLRKSVEQYEVSGAEWKGADRSGKEVNCDLEVKRREVDALKRAPNDYVCMGERG